MPTSFLRGGRDRIRLNHVLEGLTFQPDCPLASINVIPPVHKHCTQGKNLNVRSLLCSCHTGWTQITRQPEVIEEEVDEYHPSPITSKTNITSKLQGCAMGTNCVPAYASTCGLSAREQRRVCDINGIHPTIIIHIGSTWREGCETRCAPGRA